MKKKIAIFGSTGSIGTQALDVIATHPDKFEVEILTAHSNDMLLVDQAKKFNPNAVVIVNEGKYTAVKEALAGTDVKVFAGEKALEEVASFDTYDMMLAAIRFCRIEIHAHCIDSGKHCARQQKNTSGG